MTASRYEAAPDVQARRFQDEVVIVDLRSGEYFALDEIGARVWEELLGGSTVEDVVSSIERDYEAERPRIEADITALIAELTSRCLLAERE